MWGLFACVRKSFINPTGLLSDVVMCSVSRKSNFDSKSNIQLSYVSREKIITNKDRVGPIGDGSVIGLVLALYHNNLQFS